jgi:glycosyltransferase involved in cell wall biosynthesis
VPEVITEDSGGIIVDDYREMAGMIETADEVDPWVCRRYVERNFAPERMVADYIAAYEKAIAR